MDILVVGDVHCKDGVSNERLTWLGRYIVDKRPDVIVQIGDWNDMTSLCMQIKGKKSYEGKRYKADIDAGIDGLEKLFAPIEAYNKNLKPARQYKPEWYITLGNHDNRADREVEFDSKLEGTIGTEDMLFEEYGFKVVPFLQPLYLEGITFQHFFTKGLMDRAIGGANAARSILQETKASCIQGHQHILDIANATNSKGERLWGIVAGCYFEHDEDYVSKHAQKSWWRGVVMLKDVKNGDFDLECASLSMIKLKYSKTK